MDTKKLYKMGGAIIGIILFLLLCVVLLSSCSKKGSYDKLEKKLVEGAQKCITNGDVTVAEGEYATVTSDQLITAGYIKSLDKYKNDNCSGSVTIMNNGGTYNYIPYISCSNYTTISLKEKIVEDNLTTSKDGLYYANGEYIFKGTKPNNYVLFNDQKWLIMKIDANGNIKMIRINPSKNSVIWDNKYNEDTKYRSGENDYENSNMYELLKTRYNDYNENDKKHLIPTEVCIGKRNADTLAISMDIDCSKKISGQYIGLITPSEYALASYDKDCSIIKSGSCSNYNYLYKNIKETWTANTMADTSYDVIIFNGNFRRVYANESHVFHEVITVSGNEKHIKGDGTEENPYVIK